MNHQALILVLVSTIFTSLAQLTWKVGVGAVGAYWLMLISVGFVFYGTAFLFLNSALQFDKLSVVFPFVSLSFVWVLALSIIFLGEAFSTLKVLGTMSVLVGVALVGR